MVKRRTRHLTVRGGTFWIRITVPRDLRDRLRRREWKFSLRTREPRQAKLKCLEAILAIERVQTIARHTPSLTNDQIDATARAYLTWALNHATRAAQDDGEWLAQIPTEENGGSTPSRRLKPGVHLGAGRRHRAAAARQQRMRSTTAPAG